MSNLLSFSSHFRFDKTQVRQRVQESLKVAFHLLARVWERQLAGEGREQFSLFRIPWAFQVGLHHFNNLKYIWLYQNQCNLDEETKKCEKRERERKNKWRHFSKPKNGGSGHLVNSTYQPSNSQHFVQKHVLSPGTLASLFLVRKNCCLSEVVWVLSGQGGVENSPGCRAVSHQSLWKGIIA